MSESGGSSFREHRRDYKKYRLREERMPGDPMALLSQWLEEAGATSHPDPTAMTLSTVDLKGHPSSRMVLLKEISQGNLIFFTNFLSRKAREIGNRPDVAALFFWAELERQVRIEGKAVPIPESASDHYFHSRPHESKLGAWASPQSEVIPDRSFIEEAFEKYRRKFESAGEVPRPPHWGGYAIQPHRIEFWQGGDHRLHDRIVYERRSDSWERFRLAP
jgi:pyridoxamine 5'-phosphate oxidase